MRKSRRPVTNIMRVAGDAMDLALLGAALSSPRGAPGRVAVAVAGRGGGDRPGRVRRLAPQPAPPGRAEAGPHGAHDDDGEMEDAMDVQQAITVNRPPEEAYRFWHDFPNLPRFMEHLESVEVTGDGRSRWTARGPAGTKAEWEAEVTEDRPGEVIAWRSVEGSAVDTSGAVRFTPAPGGRGTEVRVELRYSPPAGVARQGRRPALRGVPAAAGGVRPAALQAGAGDRPGASSPRPPSTAGPTRPDPRRSLGDTKNPPAVAGVARAARGTARSRRREGAR